MVEYATDNRATMVRSHPEPPILMIWYERIGPARLERYQPGQPFLLLTNI